MIIMRVSAGVDARVDAGVDEASVGAGRGIAARLACTLFSDRLLRCALTWRDGGRLPSERGGDGEGSGTGGGIVSAAVASGGPASGSTLGDSPLASSSTLGSASLSGAGGSLASSSVLRGTPGSSGDRGGLCARGDSFVSPSGSPRALASESVCSCSEGGLLNTGESARGLEETSGSGEAYTGAASSCKRALRSRGMMFLGGAVPALPGLRGPMGRRVSEAGGERARATSMEN